MDHTIITENTICLSKIQSKDIYSSISLIQSKVEIIICEKFSQVKNQNKVCAILPRSVKILES